MNNTRELRPSPIAGLWYPADPERLAHEVDGYIQAAGALDLPGEAVALVAPHAGHRYSGSVAGYAYAALGELEPELVAIITPMHHPHDPPLLTCAHAAYQTPLGAVPIDKEALACLNVELQQELDLCLAPLMNDLEHSLEIQLPFLQRRLRSAFQLMPIMIRRQTAEVAECLGRALAKILSGRSAILVASTDLSHSYPQSIAESLDAEMLRRVEAFDPEGVMAAVEEGVGFACGHAALAAALWGAQSLGAERVKVLRYATSGAVSGDYRQVVGYAAAVALRPQPSAGRK